VRRKFKLPFINSSKYTFRKLLDDPDGLARNLILYMKGFSPEVRKILDKFEFETEIEKLDKANRLFQVVQAFVSPDIDLHPDRVPNTMMGHVFEDLVRRFNEAANEEAGDHFTPREVIRLMVHRDGRRSVAADGVGSPAAPHLRAGAAISANGPFGVAARSDASLPVSFTPGAIVNSTDATQEPPFDFESFIAFCASLIAREANYVEYDAAFMLAVDVLFPAPEEGALREDPALRRRLGRCMGRELWRQMPHPAHRYAPAPLPAPQRNDRCHCGSGLKYKVCCLQIERDIPFGDINLLPVLLEVLPRRRWRELAGSRVALDMVAHTAHEWLEEGEPEQAQALLEPWFADDTRLDARHEALFDTLLDAYTVLDRPRKKARLLGRALAAGDRTIRSAALQRRVTMAADAGDYDTAWALFREAQRHEPDSPSLSHLEVTVLVSQGRDDEARERARFWAQRLAGMRDPQLEPLIGFLRQVAAKGGQALAQIAIEQDPVLGEFVALFRDAPPPASLYTLAPHDGSAGALEPQPVLRKALKRWDEVCPPIGYSPIQDDASDAILATAPLWLPMLRELPLLWNSFEALDALARAAAGFSQAGLYEHLVLPMLERSERVLRAVLRANRAEGLRLEWGWLQNRPALSLLGERITADFDGPPTPEHIARLEWLVLTLNPNDNQGMRDTLVRRYLETDRLDDALALTARYPDDLASMRYNRALALFAAGRRGDALSALRDAVQRYPKPLAWLLRPDPKPPKRSGPGILIGGDDEAWEYRSQMLPLWRRLGALDWAREVAPMLGRRR
jgi:tetratricopeptide (TPR) repeat protein